MKIYFVTIYLQEKVHCIKGLTSQVYKYAYAGSREEAERASARWATSLGYNVQNVGATVAQSQIPGGYTFPEQILNLPKEALDQIYDQRGYPVEWRTQGQSVPVAS